MRQEINFASHKPISCAKFERQKNIVITQNMQIKLKKLTENCKREHKEGKGKLETFRTQRLLNYGIICRFTIFVVNFIKAFIRFQITTTHWLV